MALCIVLSPFFLSYTYPPERQAPVYDVEIIKRRIQCLKVVEGPFDDADDIYGQFLLGGYSYNPTSGGTVVKGCCIDGAPTDGKQEFVFFDRPRDQAVSLKVGQVWSIQKSRKIEGLGLRRADESRIHPGRPQLAGLGTHAHRYSDLCILFQLHRQ